MELRPTVLYVGKIKNTILMLIGLAFVILGASLIAKHQLWIGLFSILFFGVCFLISTISFIPKASNLRIDERGMEMTTLFRTTFIPWKSINSFSTQWIFVNKMVMIDFNPNEVDTTKFRNKKGALPGTYGKSAKGLAELLNSYKKQFS